MSKEYKWIKEGIWGDDLDMNPLENIDEGLLPIIKALNKKGFQTFSSCAGHPSPCGGYSYKGFQGGYISFNKPFRRTKKTCEELRNICNNNGLSDISIGTQAIYFRSLNPEYHHLSPSEALKKSYLEARSPETLPDFTKGIINLSPGTRNYI